MGRRGFFHSPVPDATNWSFGIASVDEVGTGSPSSPAREAPSLGRTEPAGDRDSDARGGAGAGCRILVAGGGAGSSRACAALQVETVRDVLTPVEQRVFKAHLIGQCPFVTLEERERAIPCKGRAIPCNIRWEGG